MRVTLNGEVVSDDYQWLYDYFEIAAFSPGVIRQALRDNPEGEELVLEINSIGGSVFLRRSARRMIPSHALALK